MVRDEQPDAAPAAAAGAVAPRRAARSSDLLAARYLLEERIASGGMAAVWRAHDERLARTVAVKILHDDLTRDEVVRERFRREAVAAAKLVHPGIVSLFDTGVDGGRVFLVIEYIQGRTLAQRLADGGPLEISAAADIGIAVARALHHAHHHDIVHRDIKPGNVLLGDDGTVKVTDFGIAKAAHDSTLTATGRVMGTAAYVAPEQLRGEDVDGRADVYSLGLVLFEALTGQRAFPGDDPIAVAQARLDTDVPSVRDLRADVPRQLDALVGRMMAPQPADRPPTAAEVATELQVFHAPPTPSAAEDVWLEADGGTSLGSELRWLLPVLGLLTLAGALVAVGIFGGVLDEGGGASLFAEEVPAEIAPTDALPADAPEDDAAQPEPEEPTEPAVRTLPLVRASAFDPQGDGSERDRFVANLVDGAPDTEWATERYNSPAFGNLKEGVGVILDLGGSHALTAVALQIPRGGFDLEIRTSSALAPTIGGWQVAAAVDDVEAGRVEIDLDTPRAAYLLVWITGDLQPFEGQFRAEIGEVEVLALAS